uniref:Uncharacterized protein n=1 Tax=Rhizophagus clarus TaxID=94130 RepID=A0A140D0C2_9GLOM|nr:hypothetical protein [Rhizophagus clarus]
MNKFIFVFTIILLITLSALVPNGEALPGGFCCKTFEEKATPVAKTNETPTI